MCKGGLRHPLNNSWGQFCYELVQYTNIHFKIWEHQDVKLDFLYITPIKIILFRRSTYELKSKQEWNKLDNEGSETSTWALYIPILILVG